MLRDSSTTYNSGDSAAFSLPVRIIALSFAVMASLLVILVLAPTARAGMVSKVERQQLKLINTYRRVHGLKRLKMDKRLTRTATWMGGDMPAYDYFDHTDHLGRDPFQRLDHFKYPSDTWRGENLAAGNSDAFSTFEQWRTSPEHKANMLGKNYKAIGIARVCVDGSTYSCYWVTEFGSRVVKRIR